MTKLFSSVRLLWCKSPSSRLQDSGLQGVRWGGGAVPQLPWGGVPGPYRSSPGLPPLPLCKRARPSPPTVAPSLRLSLPSLAVGVLPSDLPHLTCLLLTSFPQRTKRSGPAGELLVTRLPTPRPPCWLPAGCATAPRTYGPGYCAQSALPCCVPIPSPLQTYSAIPSQCHQSLASSSPHPFLFFSFYILFLYFIIFCPTSSLFQALCSSGVSHSSAQGLERIRQASQWMGNWDRSFLKVNSNFSCKWTLYSGHGAPMCTM